MKVPRPLLKEKAFETLKEYEQEMVEDFVKIFQKGFNKFKSEVEEFAETQEAREEFVHAFMVKYKEIQNDIFN